MTTLPAHDAHQAERRAVLRRRRESSVFWTAVHLLGSLRLALILLATIAVAIGSATLLESKFDSKVAAYYIYNAEWFNLWMVLLGLNLLCAALTRWPWQRQHVGFVTTHAGIILLLIGAVVGRVAGFEAMITLEKNQPASRLFLPQEKLTVIDSASGGLLEAPIDLDFNAPTEAHPLILPLDVPGQRLVIDLATQQLLPYDNVVTSPGEGSFPAVLLRFQNAGMGQDVSAALGRDPAHGTYDFFGFAQVSWVEALPENQPIAFDAKLAAPPVVSGPPRDATLFHESHMIFAQGPPLVQTDADALSGEKLTLAMVGGKPTLRLVAPDGQSAILPWVMNPDWTKTANEWQYRIVNYWPDFAMKNGQPSSLSDQPNHPAALVQIIGPTRLLPAPTAEAIAAAQKNSPKSALALRLALSSTDPHRLVYELSRDGHIYARATAQAGETFPLGWSKWQAKVETLEPSARIVRDVKLISGPVSPMQLEDIRPGLRLHVQADSGESSPPQWVPAGSVFDLLFQGRLIKIGYGQKTIPLPFTITLLDFQVPRDEGTDTPSDYISQLRFNQPPSENHGERIVPGTAHMNEPAMFPGEFWRSLLGWNYKFSQANWNPQNLDETTLQVLYDPGWPMKWVGSIGICCGILMMFYFRPKREIPTEKKEAAL